MMYGKQKETNNGRNVSFLNTIAVYSFESILGHLLSSPVLTLAVLL